MDELVAKAKWNKLKKTTDGFSFTPSGESLGRIGIFVLKKEPHERKYDSFAYLLRNEFFVFQIDNNDILNGGLKNCDVIVFPGGLCADFEIALGESFNLLLSVFFSNFFLGKEGRDILCSYIHNGGGYYGVCAGFIPFILFLLFFFFSF